MPGHGGTRRLCQAVAVLVVAQAWLVPRAGAQAGGGIIEMAWSNDHNNHAQTSPATFGPDGPWQALMAHVGFRDDGTDHLNDSTLPFWPTASALHSSVFAAGLGGRWTPQNSSRAVDTGQSRIVINPAYEDLKGPVYLDSLEPATKGTGRRWDFVNMSFAALDTVYDGGGGGEGRPATSSYRDRYPVGTLGLGLGPNALPIQRTPSFLAQLKNHSLIGSESFGMHLGSVALGLPGSMVLGGYDRARALGRAAVFDRGRFQDVVFLADVLLSVEAGGSPFAGADNNISIFRGIEGFPNITREVKLRGGKDGQGLVQLAPEWPYLGLPEATCEAAASHLPVALNERLRLYIWNTSDSRYRQIMRSPASMSFVFSDRNAENFTIKVPFQLLNLTLEAPLVNGTRLQYFPCAPVAPQGAHRKRALYNSLTPTNLYLGRAFFQAAFWGINFEQNTIFLAQAPGPKLGEAVPVRLAPDATNIPQTEDYGTFARSWEDHWTPLPDADGRQGPPSLHAGAIAGIAVGATAAGLLGIGAALVFLRQRRRRRTAEKVDDAPSATDTAALDKDKENLHELGAPAASEAGAGTKQTYEADSSTTTGVYEADSTPVQRQAYEMPSPVGYPGPRPEDIRDDSALKARNMDLKPGPRANCQRP